MEKSILLPYDKYERMLKELEAKKINDKADEQKNGKGRKVSNKKPENHPIRVMPPGKREKRKFNRRLSTVKKDTGKMVENWISF